MLGMRSSLGGGCADDMKLPVQLLQTSEKKVFTFMCFVYERVLFHIICWMCCV